MIQLRPVYREIPGQRRYNLTYMDNSLELTIFDNFCSTIIKILVKTI